MRFAPTVATLALALVMTVFADPPKTEKVPPEHQKVIDRVNQLRKLAGLQPVGYDAPASAACDKHAKYLIIHDAEMWSGSGNQPTSHDEKEGSEGYTPEGKAAAQKSVTNWREPLESVDDHFNGLFHRVSFLDPRLKSIAVGRATGGKWGVVSLIDVESGVDTKQAWDKSLVMIWPVDKQQAVPLELGNERPNPIPNDPDGKGGYPVTASFAPAAKVTAASASLTMNAKPVDAWLSSPEAPVDARYQRNTICLITMEPLKGKATYTVSMAATVDGEPWKKTWSFTTGK